VRVLIVDDSQLFLESARGLLEREGLVVAVASTRAAALEEAATVRPDVVLIDIWLGEESGLELARQIEEGNRWEHPVLVLISTRDEEEVADLIVGIPVAGFLPKEEMSANAIRRIARGETQ
jgi:DNA-binding NarL/FixJ family response regulator